MKYIAKPNTWFDEGTEAKPVTRIWKVGDKPSAVFEGIKNGKPDEEVCSLDEFEIMVA